MSSSVPLYRIVFTAGRGTLRSMHTPQPVTWPQVVKAFHDAQESLTRINSDVVYRVVAA